MKKVKLKKGSMIQSLHFSNEFFSKSGAKKWAKKHGFTVDKIDTTKNEFRIRQYSPKNITVVGQGELADGLFAIYGKPKKGYTF